MNHAIEILKLEISREEDFLEYGDFVYRHSDVKSDEYCKCQIRIIELQEAINVLRWTS